MIAKVIAFARLTRSSTAVVAGVVAYSLAPAGGAEAILAAIALALLLAGAFAFNDVQDREADAINVPTRPIPAGVLSVGAALAIAIAGSAGALGAAVATRSWRVIGLTCAMVSMLFAYSLALKRITAVKNVVMGLIGASVPLFGSISSEATGLAVAIGLFVLQKEIVADVYDRAGDARVRLRTLPVILGVRRTMWIVAAINLAFVASVAPMGGRALIAVGVLAIGVLNVVAAVTTAIRGESAVPAMLTLQKVFLLAGVLFAWQS